MLMQTRRCNSPNLETVYDAESLGLKLISAAQSLDEAHVKQVASDILAWNLEYRMNHYFERAKKSLERQPSDSQEIADQKFRIRMLLAKKQFEFAEMKEIWKHV